ncbi:hypothetical protein WM46_22350 [Citrobacter freundii complex sp. CFNIH2]|nr:hypothetical protein WM46_22350 [Citrobacter freundii complex sp. CFNIH2]
MKLKTILSSFAALGLIASSAAVAAPVDFSAAIAASGPEVGITIVPETTDMNATYTVTGDDESGYTGSFAEFAQPATFLVKSTTGGVLPALSVTIRTEAHQNGGRPRAVPVVERSGVKWGFAAAYQRLDAYAEPDGTGVAKHLPGKFVNEAYGNELAVRYSPPDGAMVAPMSKAPETVRFTPLSGVKPLVSVTGASSLDNNNGPALEAAGGYLKPWGVRKVVFPDTLDSRSLRVGLIAYASVTPLTSVGALVNGFALSVPGTLTVTPM